MPRRWALFWPHKRLRFEIHRRNRAAALASVPIES
jgi:hypothetical protein